MRSAIVTAFCLLAGLGLAGSQPTARAASDSARLTRNACVVRSITLGSGSNGVVTAKGSCYGASGKSIGTRWLHSYTQYDNDQNSCGSFVAKPGPGFAPRLNGTYSLSATFTAMPAKPNKAVKKGSRTVTLQQTGNTWMRQCGKLDPANPPAPTSLCQYYLASPDICGQLILDNGYNGPPLPQFTGQPTLVGDMIDAPPVASPDGLCLGQLGTRNSQWMGFAVHHQQYQCGKVFVLPQLTLGYMAPKGDTCNAPTSGPGPGYIFNYVNLPDLAVFATIKLPPDWHSWGGQLFVRWEDAIYSSGGLISNKTLGHEYAEATIGDETYQGQQILSGTANACTDLMNVKF